jgi:LmbE family N-acetylglucosaminyl deacetylase
MKTTEARVRRGAAALVLGMAVSTAAAQEISMHAGSLAHALDRLAVTCRVLYVAAHPDDENTRLLTWLANARHVDAAYLSMTRGGGGQNLIGREQAELLDVLRTEELLAARRLDGARQWFTRMRDFGYSKSAAETFAVWGRDAALADVVWVIRAFQPDVVVTRFDEKPPNHGHHTASAILAREAFAAAADPRRFPEQLALGVTPWQATRLVHNVPTWRNEPPPEGALPLDVGDYDPRWGLSYGELAARSRSQHQSQGFGVPGERGRVIERFVTLAGPPAERDLFDGVRLGWDRFGEAAAPLARAIDAARGLLDRDRPERALPELLAAHRALDALPDEPRVREARASLERVAAAAAGLFVRATAPGPVVVPGQTIEVAVEVIERRPAGLKLARLHFPDGSREELGLALGLNEKKLFKRAVKLAPDAPVSVPYWLAVPGPAGRHEVRDPRRIGAPRGPAPLGVVVEVEAEGRTLRADAPLQYVWTDPVRGERVREVVVGPPATVTPAREAALAPNGRPAVVALRVRTHRDGLRGSVVLPAPPGWVVEPAAAAVELAGAGDEVTLRFAVSLPAGATAVDLRPEVRVDGTSWSYREDVVDYPHIPLQVVLQPASVRLVPLSVQVPGGVVGYVAGSGDTTADDLAHLGVRVEILDDDALRGAELGRFQAIVLGIRAYNTRAALRAQHERLMRYVEAGGTVVAQYNTQSRVGPLEGRVGPYPLEIGRGRVTDQEAAVTVLAPGHELLTRPHAIGDADFAGWVQERGLYFASSWDPRYAAVLAAADAGEEPLPGGLLFARHGRGRYVYTGLAFFRQLPAGVPGAYRLFLNLIGEDR